jgi:hypothetical protein
MPDCNPATSPSRPTRRTGRRSYGLLAAGALVATSLAVSACGSSSEQATILNTEKVERAIETSSLAQRGKQASVTCPSGVHQSKGLVFYCTAVVKKGGSTRFVVTQQDGSGNVHYVAR